MKQRILLVGYYGRNNVGDEAILLSIIRMLRGRYDLTALSFNPRDTGSRMGVRSVAFPSFKRPGQVFQSLNAVNGADALAISGGVVANKLQPLSLFTWLFFLLAAKLGGKKAILLGCGCGPFRDGFLTAAAAAIIGTSDAIYPRDSTSLRSLVKIGVSKARTSTADLAFLLGPYPKPGIAASKAPARTNTKVRVLFVLPLRYHIPRLWKGERFGRKYSNYVNSVTEAADLIAEGMDASLEFLPLDKADLTFYDSVIDGMKNKGSARAIGFRNDVDSVINRFADADVVVAGRYHSIVFSILTGTPMVPIVYHPKGVDLVREIGLTRVAHELGDGIELPESNLDPRKLAASVEEVYKNRDMFRASLVRNRQKLMESSMKNIQGLYGLLPERI